MTVGTRCLGDNLGIEATHLCQRKMTKTQWMRIRPMATGTQQMDLDPKAEANHCIRKAWQKGKSLKNASAQQKSFGMMAVLQCTVNPMVGSEYQMTTCLQATSAQRIDHSLVAVLQWTIIPRVVASWQTNLSQ